MEPIIVAIPVNYTDAGKILGVFELRKLVEAAVLCIPLLAFLLFSLPFAITTNIILAAIIVVPLGGFSLMGIHDYSLLNFIRVYRKWRNERKILTFDGEIEVEPENLQENSPKFSKMFLTFSEIRDRIKDRKQR
jgi:hypothetical protein